MRERQSADGTASGGRTPAGRRCCHEEDLRRSRAAAEAGRELVYTCHAGFTEIVVPLYDGSGEFIGCMTAGQFHTAGGARPGDADFRRLAELAGVGAETLRRDSRSAVELTPEQLAGVIDYLKLMGRLVSGTYSTLLFMEQVNTPDKITLVQKYIHENYMHRLDVAGVARRFYLSPNYFSRLFRRTLGTGFNSYLNCYRVERAREMLLETELSVSEIAFACGFGSISQFNRVFRAVVRRSPGELRRGSGRA
ncbi:MAG: helix-turn-helix domain-containing protein [Lentisphaeria bacterium]|nr:helix-turn-helix domain-containing protein [Lentisphaeria bacterium]